MGSRILVVLFSLLVTTCDDGTHTNPGTLTGDALRGDSFEAGDPGPGWTWLENAGPIDPPNDLAPDAGEEGFWCAARLTPPETPFQIDRVAYTLSHGPAGPVVCDGSLQHRVWIYVSSDLVPPANATPDAELDIPTADPLTFGHFGREVEAELRIPVELNAGEHLFVSVEMRGTHPDVMCIGVNPSTPYDGDRNYWSNAASPPYPWVQLDTFGLTGNILIRARGRAPPTAGD